MYRLVDKGWGSSPQSPAPPLATPLNHALGSYYYWSVAILLVKLSFMVIVRQCSCQPVASYVSIMQQKSNNVVIHE